MLTPMRLCFVCGTPNALACFWARACARLPLSACAPSSFQSRPEKDPSSFPTAKELGKMFAMLFFIAHLLGCLWYLAIDDAAEVREASGRWQQAHGLI